MIRRPIFRTYLLALSVLLTVASCDKGAALGPLKDQAMKLVAEHSGKLAGLSAMIGPMAAKLDAIPDSIPGASALKKMFADKKTELAGLSGMLGSAKEKVEGAVKDGNKDELTGLLSSLKSAGPKLSGLSTFFTEAKTKVGDLETLAKQSEQPSGGEQGAEEFAQTLPGGYALKGASEGIESALVVFLTDKGAKVDKEVWHNFDRLVFATGSAALDMDKSQEQLTNMVEILKAYPKVEMLIGGYTDNTGKAKKNLKLSKARAESVAKALMAAGIKKRRLKAEGYGDAHPICPANDTEECRAQNRRIAINVQKK